MVVRSAIGHERVCVVGHAAIHVRLQPGAVEQGIGHLPWARLSETAGRIHHVAIAGRPERGRDLEQ